MSKKILSLVLALVMVCSLFVSPVLAADGETGASFPDSAGSWAETSIDRWANSGILQGDENGNVTPDKNLTRAEMAQVLVRLLGLKEEAENTFTDLTGEEWFASVVLKCAAAGIMKGDDLGRCDGNGSVTRQQAMTMFGRAMGLSPDAEPDLSAFGDGEAVADWAAGYMSRLAEMGILNGIAVEDSAKNIAAPGWPIDRASMFALLDKAIALYITEAGTYEVDNANGFVVVNAADEEGEVVVSGTTAGLVVAEGTTADVTAQDLTADTIKVDGETDVALEGETAVDELQVNAEATVTVGKDAVVETIEANAAAEIDNQGTVTNLNTNADGVVFDGNAPETVTTAEGVEPATDSEGKEVTEKTEEPSKPSKPSTPPYTPPAVTYADVAKAPIVDHTTGTGKTALTESELYTAYNVSGVVGAENTVNVTITATNLMKHTAGNGNVGYWVGFGVLNEENHTYKYKQDWGDVPDTVSLSSAPPDGTIEAGSKTYATFYWNVANSSDRKGYLIVEDTPAEGTAVTTTYIVDVSGVKARSDFGVSVMGDLSADVVKQVAEDNPGVPFEHKTAHGLHLTASGTKDVVLRGETTLGLLQNTFHNQAGDNGYLLYGVNAGALVKGLAFTPDTAAGNDTADNVAELGNVGGTLTNAALFNTKIWDGGEKKFVKKTMTMYAVAKNGVQQDPAITISLDATACTVEGLKKVTFDANGGSAIEPLFAEADATIKLPTPTKAGAYFQAWIVSTDSATDSSKWMKAGGNYQVTKDVTIKALWVAPVAASGVKTFEDYADYGANFTKGTATFDVVERTVRAAWADETKKAHMESTAMTHGSDVCVGVTFNKPAGMADDWKVYRSSDGGKTWDNGEDKVFTEGDYAIADGKGEYLLGDWFNLASISGGDLTMPSARTFSYIFKIVDKDGYIRAVYTLSAARTVTAAEYTVTFMDGDIKLGEVEVNYKANASDSTIDKTKTGYKWVQWVTEKGAAATLTGITADKTVYAQWQCEASFSIPTTVTVGGETVQQASMGDYTLELWEDNNIASCDVVYNFKGEIYYFYPWTSWTSDTAKQAGYYMNVVLAIPDGVDLSVATFKQGNNAFTVPEGSTSADISTRMSDDFVKADGTFVHNAGTTVTIDWDGEDGPALPVKYGFVPNELTHDNAATIKPVTEAQMKAAFTGTAWADGLGADMANVAFMKMADVKAVQGEARTFDITGTELKAFKWTGFGPSYAAKDLYYLVFSVSNPSGLSGVDGSKVLIRAGIDDEADAYQIPKAWMTDGKGRDEVYIAMLVGEAGGELATEITIYVDWAGMTDGITETATKYTIKLAASCFAGIAEAD